MATITRRGTAQWRAEVRRKGWPAIRQTFDNRRDAEDWAKGAEADMRRGVFVDRSEAEKTTFTAALDRYYREVTPNKKGAAQERRRINAWKKSDLADRTLTSITGADIAKWRDARLKAGTSPTTVRTDLALISALYKTAAKDWNLGVTNPVDGARMPSATRARTRRFDSTSDEEARLLAALKKRPLWIQALVRLAVATAMRQGEMLSLRWDDVSIRQKVAHLRDTKNGEERWIPLTKPARRAIALAWLYHREKGRSERIFRATTTMIAREWKEIIKLAEIKENLRFHDLRREATSRLFEKGLNPVEAATITGHKTLQMLKVYTNLKHEDLLKRLE